MSKGTILVTGAAGFTGTHFITHAQQQGFECIALVQSLPKQDLPCKMVACDLLDFQGLVRVLESISIDYVVHLAAIAFVAHGSAEDIYNTNIVGTTNLLDAVIKNQSDVKKVLVASSGNVYGNTELLPISEANEIDPVNDYAVSKCAVELAVKIRSHQLPIVITRPFNYTGVNQNPSFLVPKIVTAFKNKQQVLELGNLDVARDFSDVRDLVRAYQLLLEHPESHDVYNVCSGDAISLKAIIQICENIAGYKLSVKVNPEFVRNNEIKTLFGTDAKLHGLIGNYRHFKIEDTIRWMIES